MTSRRILKIDTTGLVGPYAIRRNQRVKSALEARQDAQDAQIELLAYFVLLGVLTTAVAVLAWGLGGQP